MGDPALFPVSRYVELFPLLLAIRFRSGPEELVKPVDRDLCLGFQVAVIEKSTGNVLYRSSRDHEIGHPHCVTETDAGTLTVVVRAYLRAGSRYDGEYVKAASRPPDQNHPYGHHQYEALGGIGVACPTGIGETVGA